MKSILGIMLDHPETGEPSPALAPRGISSVFTGATNQVRSGVVSLFDQGVVSGTNFFTTLILARTCSQDELGAYSLAWTIVLFLAAIQGNLITVPYTMYCHRRSGPALAQYAGSTLAYQLLTSLAAIASFFVLDVLLSLGLGPERLRPAASVLLGVIPFLLLREYARRFAFAHLALATAVTVDAVAGALQIAILLALRQFGLLSAASVYAAMGMACAAASLCWWFLDKQPMQFSRSCFFGDWHCNWAFGKWAVLSQLTGLAFYALPWMLASVHGEAETGELAACSTLVGLANLFVLGLNNLLMPKAARAFSQHGAQSLFAVLCQAAACTIVVLGGLTLLVYFVGNTMAGLILGVEYADTGPLLTMLSLATLTDAIGLTASTGLWTMDRPGLGIIGDVAQLIVTLAAAICLVAPYGALGITTALVAGRTAGSFVRWLTLWLLMSVPQRCEPETA